MLCERGCIAFGRLPVLELYQNGFIFPQLLNELPSFSQLALERLFLSLELAALRLYSVFQF